MKWLREPLAQFLLIGAVLFGVFALWGGPATGTPGQYHIVITPGMVQNLRVSFQDVEKLAPTDAELSKSIDTYVREEILNREARALGIDQDDPNIRSWLSKRMEFYLEGNAVVPPPTDAQLESFLQKNALSFPNPDGTLPTLAEKHEAVRQAWEADQQRQAAAAAYDKLRARYIIELPKSLANPPSAAPSATSDKK
jgi:hypothetical protein